ncbi:MAG: plastocyanin/azurin family copper-binding protein [Hyphomicrobiales bacterium]
MRKLLFVLPALAIALVAFARPGASDSALAQDGSLTLRAGDGESGYSINQFLPKAITVTEGTTVTWQFPWFEPHTVTIPGNLDPNGPEPEPTLNSTWPNDAGYLHSGTIFGDPSNPPTFSTTFTTAGTYTYICVIHPNMAGTVTVIPEGEAADTQADVDARGDAEYAENIAAVKAVAAATGASAGSVTPRDDGTNLYQLAVGAVDAGGNDAQQFFPATANLKVGDTIEWTNDTMTPHTVTFNGQLLGPPPGGDPFAFPVSNPGTFTGSELVHSGIIWAIPDPTASKTFELTFGTAGTFQYVCILHADQGMVGTVNVQQAATPTSTATPTATTTTAPKPPNTGTGNDSGLSASWLLVIGAAGAFLAAGGAFATASLRRR